MEGNKWLNDDSISPSLVDVAYSDEYLNSKIKEEKLKSLQQDREHRKTFSKKIFNCVFIYVIIILVIIVFNGFKLFKFNLDNSVLITLLSTTTANIVGLLAFVVRYLFHNK